MDRNTIDKFVLTILEFAIADEKASQEKYKWLALNSTKKNVQEIFLHLYQEERQHEKKMKSMYNDMKKALEKQNAAQHRRKQA